MLEVEDEATTKERRPPEEKRVSLEDLKDGGGVIAFRSVSSQMKTHHRTRTHRPNRWR